MKATDAGKAAKLKQDLLQASRALLVTKATAVIVGLTFNQSVVATYGYFSPSSDTTDSTVPLLFAVVLLLFLVLVCAFVLNEFEKYPKLPDEWVQTYVAGVKLIPVWSYKDVVVSLAAALTAMGVLEAENATYAGLFAVLVGLISAASAIGLHVLSEHAKLDKSSISSRSSDILEVSFALGVGYAVNQTFSTAAGTTRWSSTSFMVCYAGVMTAVIPPAQQQATKLLAANGADWPLVMSKTATFLIAAGNFVLGWAWDGLFDASIGPLGDTGFWGQLSATLIISAICIFATASIIILDDKALTNAATLTAAMNIGWTWTDLANLCLPETGSIVSLWFYTVCMILIALLVATVLERIIDQVEQHLGKEETEHLLGAKGTKV